MAGISKSILVITLFFWHMLAMAYHENNDGRCVFVSKDSLKNNLKLTPFAPKSNYETAALRLRALPWTIGDNYGANLLIGVEVGFFKAHSLSADLVKNFSNSNVDAHFEKDSLLIPSRYRTVKSTEFHFSYNYHLNLPFQREERRLNFYTGINYRMGTKQLQSDTGMYINDHLVSAETRYFSVGPQIGSYWSFGPKNFLALNVNVVTFYNIKHLNSLEIIGVRNDKNTYVFKTVDFRLAVNLIIWLRYFER